MQCRKRARAEADEADAVVTLDPTQHYDMADMTRENESILEWVFSNRSDVATKVQCSMPIWADQILYCFGLLV
jgi:hypothetical protein